LTHHDLKVNLLVFRIASFEVLLFVEANGTVEATVKGDGLLGQGAVVVNDLASVFRFLNRKPADLILDKDHFERVVTFCISWNGVWVLTEVSEDFVKVIVKHNRWELGGIIKEA